MTPIIKDHLEKSISYSDYRKLIIDLLSEHKTTGFDQTEEYINYSKLANARMRRWDKTLVLPEDLKNRIQSIDRSLFFLTITEGWCADAAQAIPVIEKITQENDQIQSGYVLRDDNPDLMNLFLTNGSRSIPIVIVIDSLTLEILGYWGPRPSTIQKIVLQRKNDPNASPYSEFVVEAQKWYIQDKGSSIMEEFTDVLFDSLAQH